MMNVAAIPFERISVVDVETTGLFPRWGHRVIEIAVVTLEPRHGIVDEFCTLINPDRDIGSRQIHGLTASDLVRAPTFQHVAAEFVARVAASGALAAHNARFDTEFLESEFDRIGLSWPRPAALCTMRLARRIDSYAGRSLRDCCDAFGIEFRGDPHSALADARATAELLLACLSACPHSGLEECLVCRAEVAVEWPRVASRGAAWLTRESLKCELVEPPSFLQRLLAQVGDLTIVPDGATAEYLDLLDRCLEDRVLNADEHDALFETAARWGLSAAHVLAAHHEYLRELSVAAWADGVVTDVERRDLLRVARLLGESAEVVEQLLRETAAQRDSAGARVRALEDFAGQTVCFTGELIGRIDGNSVSRDVAHLLASAAGLKVVNSVTKKLDLLVVADPHTRSGKAKKARQYGIRILHEPVFWRALGVEVE